MSKEQNAFDAAVEIVAATLTEKVSNPNKQVGTVIGDYFQAIYHKLLEIAPEEN